jgi:putative transposase
MGRRGREQLKDQRLFFVTTTARGFEPVFGEKRRARAMRDLIFEVVERHRALLFGYVVMPNHIHLLVGVQAGGAGLSRLMKDLKSLSWRRFFANRPGVWMPRFDDLAICSEKQFRTKLDYIHNNPVRAGLVSEPDHYEFSSAIDWLGEGGRGSVVADLDFRWPSGRDA